MRFRASRAGANNLGDAALSASNRRSPESKAMPRWRLLSARGGDVVGAPGTARDFPGVKLTIDQRVYAASCVRQVEPGMVVKTTTEDVAGVRRTLLELLMADHPTPCQRQQLTHDCELEHLASQAGLTASRYPGLPTPRGHDESSASIAVDHDSCILCDRCIRGCSEIRHNFVLARRGKGYQAGIACDENLPMGESTCVSCGECMVSCPTGALINKKKEIATDLPGTAVPIEELQLLEMF